MHRIPLELGARRVLEYRDCHRVDGLARWDLCAAAAAERDVLEGHRARPAEALSVVPQPPRWRTDAVAHLRSGAPLGQGHQAADDPPADAAVVRRTERWHPTVQG